MPPKPRSAIDRLLPRLEVSLTGCWEWTGATNWAGYGKISVGGRDGSIIGTHRVVYEHFVGPITPELQIDHLCRNPPCCNPSHLEAVTPRVNTVRGVAPSARNAAKSVCDEGHPFNLENTYIWNGERHCRSCRREADSRRQCHKTEYMRVWRARKRAAA